MKRLGVFLLPPGWDAGPSQGYPPSIMFTGNQLYTWVETGNARIKCLAKNTMHCPRPGLEPGLHDPETSTVTIETTCLPLDYPIKKTIKSLPSFNFPMMVCISLFIFWKSSLSADKRLYISLCWLLKYIQVNPGKQENSVYTTGWIKDLIEGGSTNEPSKAFPWRGTWASSPWKCLNWGH